MIVRVVDAILYSFVNLSLDTVNGLPPVVFL